MNDLLIDSLFEDSREAWLIKLVSSLYMLYKPEFCTYSVLGAELVGYKKKLS